MRDDPAESVVSQSPLEPAAAAEENKNPSVQSAKTIHVRELHLYTIPNREYSGHYPNSPLFQDIVHNPALYMDRADF